MPDGTSGVITSGRQRPPRRGRGRPRKAPPVPNIKGLPALPPELIGRIATFLIPSPPSVKHGFAPPTELPYGAKKGLTQTTRLTPYGGVPSGVRDVLRLARTCRQCEAGVSLVVGRIGNANTKEKKRTLYISLPYEDSRRRDSEAYTQASIDESLTGELFERIKASSETLEQLIVHECSHHDSYAQSTSLPSKDLGALQPFQNSSTTFPNLWHLQIGQHVCQICSSTLLRLFCDKTFVRLGSRFDKMEDIDEEDIDDPKSKAYSHTSAVPRRHSSQKLVEEHDEPAAPALTSIVLYQPVIGIRDVRDPYRHGAFLPMQRFLHSQFQYIAFPDRIKLFQLWVPASDYYLGGMGPAGSVTTVSVKSAKVVEADLTEWAQQELDKGMSAQERLLAKFKAQAKHALPPRKRKSSETDSDPTASGSKTKTDKGSPLKQPKLEPKSPRSSTSSGREDQSPRKLDDEDNDDDSDNANGANLTLPTATIANPTGTTAVSTQSRAARHAERAQETAYYQYKQALRLVAEKMPNIVGLSILQRDNTHTDVTEGVSDIAFFGSSFVEPLSKLEHLRYLDMGLAVIGQSEVSNFPLGLSFGPTRHGQRKAKAQDIDPALQALKRRKYTLNMTKARNEGDQWRMKLLNRFVDVRPVPVVEHDGGSEGNGTSNEGGNESNDTSNATNHDSNDDEGDGHATWPRSLKSGYFVAPDLENRKKHNGLMIPWFVEGGSVKLGQPVHMRL